MIPRGIIERAAGIVARFASEPVSHSPADGGTEDHALIFNALAARDVDTLARLAESLHAEHVVYLRIARDLTGLARLALVTLQESVVYRVPDPAGVDPWDASDMIDYAGPRGVEAFNIEMVRQSWQYSNLDELEDLAAVVVRPMIEAATEAGDVDTLARLASVSLAHLTLYRGASVGVML